MSLNKLISKAWLPWFGMVICAIMTMTTWFLAWRTEQRRIHDRFQADTVLLRELVTGRMAAKEQSLRGAAEFAAQHPPRPTRAQWHDYAKALDLEHLDPGIQGLGFAEWIPDPAVDAHVRRLRAEGFKDYQVVPGGPLPPEGGVSAIIYLEPMDARNQRAFSHDMYAEATRRAAMARARDTGEPALTGRVKLYQETATQVQMGTLLYAPVYRRGAPIGTGAQRRAAFLGWTYMAFRMQNLLDGIVGSSAPGVEVQLFDGPADHGDNLLCGRIRTGARPFPVSEDRLAISGRTWTLRTTPGPQYTAMLRGGGHRLVLVAGLLGTALIFLLLRTLAKAERLATGVADARLEQLQLLLESMGEAIYGIDLDGLCTFCNPACLRMTGYTRPEEILGLNMPDLIHHSHAGGAPFDVNDCRIFQAIRGGVGTHVDDEVLWRADGTCFPAEYWAFPQFRDGVLIGAAVTFIDITERVTAQVELRTAEERWKEALDAAGDGVWDWDLVHGTTHFSPRWKGILGYAEAELSSDRQEWLTRIHPEDRETVDQVMRAYVQGQTAKYRCEYRLRCKDGRWKWVLARGMAARRNAEGTPDRIIGTIIDINPSKDMEADLKAKDHLLDAVCRALVELLDASDLDHAFTGFLDTLGEGAGASRAFIIRGLLPMPEAEDDYEARCHEWCAPGIPPKVSALTFHATALEAMGIGPWLEAFRQGQVLSGPVSGFPEAERAFLGLEGTRSLLAVPIFVQGRLLGVIGFDECGFERAWSQAELDILRLSAQAVGAALEREQAYSEIEEARQELERRVASRTQELSAANRGLRDEVVTRERTEDHLSRITQGLVRLGPDMGGNILALVALIRDLTAADDVLFLEREGPGFRLVCANPDGKAQLPDAIAGLDAQTLPLDRAVFIEVPAAGDRPAASALIQAVGVEQQVLCAVAAFQAPRGVWSAEDMTVVGILAAAAGIERRRWRAEENRARAQMLTYQQSKLESVGRLAAGIAHEINTPLQYLSLNMAFLKETYGTVAEALGAAAAARPQELDWVMAETSKVIADSTAGIDQVVRLVRAMKEFSHPGSPDPMPVNLNACLESAVTVSRNEWKYVADVTLDLAPGLPMIQGFPAELNQVFLNLIVNAAQAIGGKPRGEGAKGEIHVSTAPDAEGVVIRVRDTGTGIAPEHQAKVFDPFFTTKEVGVGTGQGLMVCYQTVVVQHGGGITFETRPGEGTTFVVRIPLRAPAPRKGSPRTEVA